MVPELIKEQFWQLRESIASFTIAAGRDVIPWELLYPLGPERDEGFLVEQFPVMRRVYGQQRFHRIPVTSPCYIVPPGSPENAQDLNTVATATAGGGVDFRIPFLGMKLQIGGTVTHRDTHTIGVTLVPADIHRRHEIRDSQVETLLLDAIATIRTVMTRAADGDDPFLLQTGMVELCFAITKDGTITLGVNGELKDEITHSLRISLEIPRRPDTRTPRG